jgi:hypothetical protein
MEDPDRLHTFNTFMEAGRGSRTSWLEWFPVREQIVDGFDISIGDVLLVDVAGGRGHDIEAFLGSFPDVHSRLVLEEMPSVLGDISNLSSSIERVEFDLFKKQPMVGKCPPLYDIERQFSQAKLTKEHAHTVSDSLFTIVAPTIAERSSAILPQQ